MPSCTFQVYAILDMNFKNVLIPSFRINLPPMVRDTVTQLEMEP